MVINPARNFMSTSDEVETDVGWRINPNRRPAFDVFSIITGNIQAAAFILLHELGHRTKSYEDNDDDGDPLAGAINNGKIHDACFRNLRRLRSNARLGMKS